MYASKSRRSQGGPEQGLVFRRATGDRLRPVRCFSCGKLLGDKFEEFEVRVQKGGEPKRVLDELGIKRYCCRTTILTSVDLVEEIAKFKR